MFSGGDGFKPAPIQIYLPPFISRPSLPRLGYRTVSADPVELRYLDLGQVNYASPSTLLHLMERCDKLIVSDCWFAWVCFAVIPILV